MNCVCLSVTKGIKDNFPGSSIAVELVEISRVYDLSEKACEKSGKMVEMSEKV